MTRLFKSSALALAAAAVTLTAFAASAEPVPYGAVKDPTYDGYCYAKKEDVTTKDAVLGAAAGAIAGGLLGKKGDKTKSAAIGAAVGGAAGYIVSKNSKEKIRCSKGKYYVYTKGYYEPADADRGFKVVFFEERPDNVDLYYISSRGKILRYKGN